MADNRTLAEVQETCDKACAILQKANDGDDLEPSHLYLVQEAVNGFLTEEGKAAFEDLYRQVQAGYKKPWFHGIEHLTRDHAGYVYWKGTRVEHYSFRDGKNEAKAAYQLAQRCRHLEGIGVEVNGANAIWKWEKYKDEKGGTT